MTTPKSFEETKFIKATSFNKDDLIILSKLAQEGIPDEEHFFKIYVKYNNASVEFDTVEEIFDNEDLPDVLDDLTIACWFPRFVTDGSNTLKKSTHIDLNMHPQFSVGGVDEFWVRGKAQKLSEFFEEKAWKKRSTIITNIARNNFTMSVIIGLWLVCLVIYISRMPIFYSIIISISSVYLILKYVAWSIFHPLYQLAIGVKIVLRGKEKLVLGMEQKEWIPIVINIGILIATLIAPLLSSFFFPNNPIK